MENKIKFLDLTQQYKSVKKEIDFAIKRVFNTGRFIGGEEVEKFEKEIAKFCGVKYAISVNSGTDALFLSLKVFGVGTEDEVITTPFTFIATAEVIVNVGAKPVFVDIDPKTFNINPSKIEEKITKKTKAILPVHLFGQMAEMNKIKRIAKKYKLFVIEDAAQAIGSDYKNKRAGSISEAGCFSFYPTKNLSAYGDGGMVITNDKKIFNKIRMLRSHGSSPKNKYYNLILGINSRLDAIQAATLRVKLRCLQKWNKKRGENAKFYDKMLEGIGDIIVPYVGPGQTHIFHQYTIRTKFRNDLMVYLYNSDIPTQIYYPLPLHLQPAFSYLGYKRDDFPEAERAAKEVLSLPIYPEISKFDQKKIIKKIKEFFKDKNLV